MLKRGQFGFTLIEVTLVLAISGLLGAVALAGQTQLRERARFTDSVEFTMNALAKVRNEANTTVQSLGTGANASGYMFFAKRVKFNLSSDLMNVDTLLFNPATNSIVAGAVDPYTVKLPWDFQYHNAVGALISSSNEVIFVRWPYTGRLYTYTSTSAGFAEHTFSSYDPSQWPSTRAIQTYQFSATASTTHSATITIEGSTDTFTKVFNP